MSADSLSDLAVAVASLPDPRSKQGVSHPYHGSTDEKTGIQALQRAAPALPMEPGKVERIEYAYDRNGTTNLFGNLNVATGEIVAPKLSATRTAEEFAENIDAMVETDPNAQWVFVCDHLNTP